MFDMILYKPLMDALKRFLQRFFKEVQTDVNSFMHNVEIGQT